MKKILCISGMCGILLFVSGCVRTRVAGVKRSQEENAWENVIRRNYPGYRAPRAAAPAIYNHTEERVSARIASPLKPEKDPATAETVNLEQNDKPVSTAEPVAVESVKSDAVPAPEQDAEKTGKNVEPVADKAADKAADKVSNDAAVEAKTAATPPDPTGSKVYVVQAGDTLGKIAMKNYGDARHSNVIFKANSDILKNPNQIRPGMKLIVPAL